MVQEIQASSDGICPANQRWFNIEKSRCRSNAQGSPQARFASRRGQGRNPLFLLLGIGNFPLGSTSKLNISIGSATCKPARWISCVDSGAASVSGCPSLYKRPPPGLDRQARPCASAPT